MSEALGRIPVPHPPSSTFHLDRSVATLRERAAAWPAVPIERKIQYLRGIIDRTAVTGAALVRDAIAAKGGDRRYAGEDWVGGPTIQTRAVRVLAGTLEGIRRTGRVPIPAGRVSTRPDGQVVIRVLPHDRWDRTLFFGQHGEVWLDPEIGLDELDGSLGSIYTKPETAEPGVAAVLGAGNVASIAPLDVIHKLFVEGKVAILKFNPVNDYIGPHTERVFADLIADGFVRTAYGGADVGSYLVDHPGTDAIHVTGAISTHDAVVFGPGEEGAARKARNEPVLTKPITSELGNVSPVIVVPGSWKERDLRFHAEHVATQMTQNNGFNCIAAKVLVFHESWPQKDAFLDHLRAVLGSLPARPAFYPGSAERWEGFVDAHPGTEVFGPAGPGSTAPALAVGLDPESADSAFTEEAFCSVAATTDLPAGDVVAYLAAATDFCNHQLMGTLKATLLIDPDTAKQHAAALDRAIADLEYGTVAVNIWGAVTYGLGTTPWGGYPGATLDDIQSGRGFVHNGLLIDRPQKSVVFAPFRQFPKPAWFVTHRNSVDAMRRFAEFENRPGVGRLLRLIAASVRG
jgi:acyl-CoA reductase-like NAD-dependent aldehyde dehydrogenase